MLKSRFTVYFESLNECICDSTDVMPCLHPLPDGRSRLVQRKVPSRLQIEQDGFLFVQHRERHVGGGAVVHVGVRFETSRLSGGDSDVDKGHAEACDPSFRTSTRRQTTHDTCPPPSRRRPVFSKASIANKRILYVFNHINGTAFLFLRISDHPLAIGPSPRKESSQKRTSSLNLSLDWFHFETLENIFVHSTDLTRKKKVLAYSL